MIHDPSSDKPILCGKTHSSTLIYIQIVKSKNSNRKTEPHSITSY